MDVIRQLDADQIYEYFLIALMKIELDSRHDSTRRIKVKAAGFPCFKTIKELDISKFEHMNKAYIHELASCDFFTNRKRIVIIGNPETGKTHLSMAWESNLVCKV